MWSRARTFNYSTCLSLLSLLSACGTSIHAPLQPIEVTFSHAGTGPTTIGDVHAASGQHVKIKITDTNAQCFAFNTAVVTQNGNAKEEAPKLHADQTVEFDLEMRDDPLEVTIEARKQGSNVTECNSLGLSERVTGGQLPPWKIRILREGWDIAFAGGYTADTVTNPVFGLVAGQKQIDPAPAPKTSGFFVQTFPGQEDAYRLGAAAMVHVFHTSSTAFSWHDISWTPVSFGLGVGDASQVRYFLGSGVKFGPKFFLTGGVAVGSVKTLPTGLKADNATDSAGFTTNANALSTLGSKTRAGAFIGVSYTFAGVGPSAFTGPFTPVQPAGSAVADFNFVNPPKTLSLTLVGTNPTVNSTFTISVSGGFNAGVKLSAEVSPNDVIPTFEHQSITGPGSSTMTLTANASTAAKDHTVTVTGDGGGKKHVVPITLTVTKPAS